jgi:type III restriction enzyme
MDAIESGIVKIPRVPVSDNSLGYDMPVWRKLWPEIRDDMPRKGAKKAGPLDPEKLPTKLLGALHALYEHYEASFGKWEPAFAQAGLAIPPVFIVVCQNTSHSKLLYDYIAGYERTEKTAEGHADGRLGRKYGHAYPRRAGVRHPAPLRAGGRPRAAARFL